MCSKFIYIDYMNNRVIHNITTNKTHNNPVCVFYGEVKLKILGRELGLAGIPLTSALGESMPSRH